MVTYPDKRDDLLKALAAAWLAGKMLTMTRFLEVQPSTQNRWRALVLLGRNTASYKFALATALLSRGNAGGELITLDDLALPFAQALAAHVRHAPKQGATNLNRAMQQACEGYNAGQVSDDLTGPH